MKFQIRRVKHSEKPIESAYTEDCVFYGKHFHKSGSYWFIDIDSLEELLDLMRKMGEDLILSLKGPDGTAGCITIYDDCVE